MKIAQPLSYFSALTSAGIYLRVLFVVRVFFGGADRFRVEVGVGNNDGYVLYKVGVVIPF